MGGTSFSKITLRACNYFLQIISSPYYLVIFLFGGFLLLLVGEGLFPFRVNVLASFPDVELGFRPLLLLRLPLGQSEGWGLFFPGFLLTSVPPPLSASLAFLILSIGGSIAAFCRRRSI